MDGPKFEIKVGRIKTLNPGVFTQALYNNIKELWVECAQQFLLATATQIHVDTGMSMASLLPLAKTVNLLLVVVPERDPRKGLTDISGLYRRHRFKSMTEGEKAGKKAFTLTFGSAAQPVMRFRFEILIFQYLMHEFGLVPHTSGPWNSVLAGETAFREHFQKNWNSRVPNLPHFLVSGKLKGGLT